MHPLKAVAICTIVLCTVAVADAGAQATTARPTKKAPPRTIEIRGVLPTPQVITVRPRDVPTYDRGGLADYFDRHFDHALDAPLVVMNGTIGGVRLAPRTAATVARMPNADARRAPRGSPSQR